MIKATKIYKSFGDHEVLKDVNFTFEQGKNNLIIGASGAGKTVLLKILVGLITPTSGQVWFNDQDVCRYNRDQLRELRMDIGMLFQANALFDSMTVGENIRFPMDMFTNRTMQEKEKQVDYCLERVNLEGINDKYPSEISGGMQKRVGIARAIVLEPKYLFCDEPNSGLDPTTAITIDELISNLTKDNNITTVINTHDMNSVMEIGDNICLLDQGEVAWTGNKDEILQNGSPVISKFIFASPFLQRLKKQAMSK